MKRTDLEINNYGVVCLSQSELVEIDGGDRNTRAICRAVGHAWEFMKEAVLGTMYPVLPAHVPQE